mgnify:CR=1 FL=1
MTRQRRNFDPSFKLEVVKMIKEQRLSVQHVCQTMSIGPTAVRRLASDRPDANPPFLLKESINQFQDKSTDGCDAGRDAQPVNFRFFTWRRALWLRRRTAFHGYSCVVGQ